MSETAHDLRSPLNTIRESIRLVSEGELGEINEEQRGYLEAAIDQCSCVDQLVGEMVQVERLRTGMPRARRHWVSVLSIREAVMATLRPWSIPRNVRVLWDGANDPNAQVFADPTMIRRLIVNLVANAIRVTADGESVMVRVSPNRHQTTLQWSVVDQGRGIAESDLKHIANHQVSLGGGEGLGLTICRQLSALHFSSLMIESRLGVGTVASFDTPAGGPVSVAESWTKWRLMSCGETTTVRHVEGSRRSRGRFRFDKPLSVIELHADGKMPRFNDQLTAGIVVMGAAMPKQVAQTFDLLLQTQMSMYDFVYQIDSRRWVWVFDADERGAERKIDEINRLAKDQVPAIRLSWGEAKQIPLDEERTASRLSDLLVRHSLSSAKTLLPVTDGNQVRLGTAPIAESPMAAQRLDVEVENIRSRLASQAQRSLAIGSRLAPPVN